MERPQTLRLRDVSVAWDDEPVVRHVSFELKPGERLALLGSSGSGKSTLAAATLRLIEHRGSITLDDVEISELSDFRHHVSALLQTTYVFGTTVRENLRIANPHATDTEVVAALTAAGLVDWFSHLEAGLDTVIGDGARGMSGGEIQRLGIARVLLTQSTFVILDEPTEHLDAPTAAAVWQTMKSALADRGVLLITHDQQLAADCHRQIRIENGTLRP
jgi:ABC-type transport system involved in cytochrome bd biosynthesis fused ATPase/permease subunit